ncbi:MAG: hypothetical protein D8M59_14355 [Planctomycetes bacterium]|nr:hypothetical protein [Planctomycetota bacterium]NOG55513.1 hypothetical protein [Planctomycetota bacterium]
MPPPAHTVFLKIRIAEGKRDAFLAFLREAIPFYERGGDSRMRLLADPNDPMQFIEVVEYFTDEAKARGEHEVQNDPETIEYLQRWRALLDGPPTVEYWAEATGDVKG